MNSEFIKKLPFFEQRDILAILVNLFSLDKESFRSENFNSLYYNLLYYSDVEDGDEQQIVIQEEYLKPYYEDIVIEELSIVAQKYLNYIFEYIIQNTKSDIFIMKSSKIISSFRFDIKIKDDLKESVASKNMDIESIIFNDSIKKVDKQVNIFTDTKNMIFKNLAFSSTDGDYGIKTISKGDTNTIHIFINGFTNDSKTDTFSIWKEKVSLISNEDDTFLGYAWASGKDPTSEIMKLPDLNDLMNPTKYISLMKGFNPFAIGGVLAVQVLAEWKQAKIHSQEYCDGLSQFIQKQHHENKEIQINLYGHSLGANLIYHTLENLYHRNIKINNIYLFGGASSNDKLNWTHIQKVCTQIYNFYSENDFILKYLYRTTELAECPIGLEKINVEKRIKQNSNDIKNYNVSNIVKGHSEYLKNLNRILMEHYC